jgi:hypothetical protein
MTSSVLKMSSVAPSRASRPIQNALPALYFRLPVLKPATGLYDNGKLVDYGAGNRVRTRDPLITNQVLYQLSYTGGKLRLPLESCSGNGGSSRTRIGSSHWMPKQGSFRFCQ